MPTVHLDIHVVTNAKQSEVVSKDGSHWRVRLAAKPVEGAANDALVELIAEEFGVAKSLVEIKRGHHSRNKQVIVVVPDS
ncbi:MAG: DUF167 domain-containing protein [Patescibacteria group bacterium]|nr:DUF167 domain-containing protein [Patescibacteria group bacterium]